MTTGMRQKLSNGEMAVIAGSYHQDRTTRFGEV
jgi:hypothetical protein